MSEDKSSTPSIWEEKNFFVSSKPNFAISWLTDSFVAGKQQKPAFLALLANPKCPASSNLTSPL